MSLASAAATASITTNTTTSPSSTTRLVSLNPPISFLSRVRRLWIKTSQNELKEAEAEVMKVVKTPYTQELVGIENEQFINTVHFSRQTRDSVNPSLSLAPSLSLPHKLVLLHGFGAGLALYMSSFDHLSHHFNDVYAIDLLGCGRSSRPSFTASNHIEAEEFFVTSLESWRKRQGIDKMTLCAHSLGGYFGAAYALQYPDRVERLVLISPVGVPDRPTEEEMQKRKLPTQYRVMYNVFAKLWEWGVTPQSAVKLMGPFPYGKRAIESYVMKRFTRGLEESVELGELSENGIIGSSSSAEKTQRFLARHTTLMDKPAVSSYLYHNWAQSGSGEFALSKVLAPGAWAYNPIGERLIQELTGKHRQTSSSNDSGGNSSSDVNCRIPTTLIYGTDDWMTPESGVSVAVAMRNAGGAAAVVRVKNAGHQVFLDNPVGFAEAVLYACTYDDMDHHKPGTGLKRNGSRNSTSTGMGMGIAADTTSKATHTALRSLYATGFRNIIIQDQV